MFVSPSAGLAGDAGSVAFFEAKIRPVLIEHCYECHRNDSDSLGGGLSLDHAAGMLEGGDSGPAVVPGDVDASELIAAIRYESTEMPPESRLDASTIRHFEDWVAAGAVDPRDDPVNQRMSNTDNVDLEAGRRFWAFSPRTTDQSRSVDDHLDDALAAAGLHPLPPAGPAAALRRLTFDLVGLPPTERQLDGWLANPSEKRWRRLVDELLASPDFGVHWARHWMDVARYADSNGSDFNAAYHDAWRYRDYLVRAFNADRSFDQMIRQQVAGDLMQSNDRQERCDQIIATTFLMLGTKMLSERDKAKLTMDVVDEQIDTIGRAFMGLTLGCARCHDHKFDPIPTRDYYALAGIFRSTRSLEGESQEFVSTWKPTPLPIDPDWTEALAKHREQQSQIEAELDAAKRKLHQLVEKYPLPGIVVDDDDAIYVGNWVESTASETFVGRGYRHDGNRDKHKSKAVFKAQLTQPGNYEVRFHYAAGGNRAAAVPVASVRTVADRLFVNDCNVDQTQTGSGGQYEVVDAFTLTRIDEAVNGVDVSVTVSNESTSGYVIVDAVQWVLLDASVPEVKADPLQAAKSQLLERKRTLQENLKRHRDRAPAKQPTAMAVADRPADQVGDSPVMIRGETHRPGPSVPRGFLRVCNDLPAEAASPLEFRGSGRLELANWLTDPDHPLTARVYVNRVWMHLMGEGLVRTVDNFGVRGDRPSHHKLLDDLAKGFINARWRTKALVRRLVLSQAYRRATPSALNDQTATYQAAMQVDPTNRLLWRAHRRRLTAESIRDAMLVVSGGIDRRSRREPLSGVGVLVNNNKPGSKTVATANVASRQRTASLLTIRSAGPPLLVNLDAADPNLIVGKRPTTNVPATAMVLMGSPEVRRWAEQAAERMVEHSAVPHQRVDWLTRHVLGRPASEADHALMAPLVEDASAAQFLAAMFASTEFRILD